MGPQSGPASASSDPIKTASQGDGLLGTSFSFNIATVLGRDGSPRRRTTGNFIDQFVDSFAALLFFVPSALVINELSSRFSRRGRAVPSGPRNVSGILHGSWPDGILDLHVFYFPGCAASRGDERVHYRRKCAALRQNRTFLLSVSVGVLVVAALIYGRPALSANGMPMPFNPLLRATAYCNDRDRKARMCGLRKSRAKIFSDNVTRSSPRWPATTPGK